MTTELLAYRFTFVETTEKAKAAGLLANFDLDVYLGPVCFLHSEKWIVKDGPKGLWPCPPSVSFKDVRGTLKYIKHIQLWPRGGGPANWAELSRLNDEFKMAYKVWRDGLATAVPVSQRPPIAAPGIPTSPMTSTVSRPFWYQAPPVPPSSSPPIPQQPSPQGRVPASPAPAQVVRRDLPDPTFEFGF